MELDFRPEFYSPHLCQLSMYIRVTSLNHFQGDYSSIHFNVTIKLTIALNQD